jgi:hypothetical protein
LHQNGTYHLQRNQMATQAANTQKTRESKMDKFRSWLTSELKVEANNARSQDFSVRKSANVRHESLQHGIRLLDEYAQRPSAQTQSAPAQ